MDSPGYDEDVIHDLYGTMGLRGPWRHCPQMDRLFDELNAALTELDDRQTDARFAGYDGLDPDYIAELERQADFALRRVLALIEELRRVLGAYLDAVGALWVLLVLALLLAVPLAPAGPGQGPADDRASPEPLDLVTSLVIPNAPPAWLAHDVHREAMAAA